MLHLCPLSKPLLWFDLTHSGLCSSHIQVHHPSHCISWQSHFSASHSELWSLNRTVYPSSQLPFSCLHASLRLSTLIQLFSNYHQLDVPYLILYATFLASFNQREEPGLEWLGPGCSRLSQTSLLITDFNALPRILYTNAIHHHLPIIISNIDGTKLYLKCSNLIWHQLMSLFM